MRPGRLWELATAACAVVGIPLWVAASRGTGAAPEVATARVERRTFVRRVPAEGYLRAVEATPITVPATAEGSLRIAWLAPDGAEVAVGDPVVRFDPSDMERQLADASADLESAEIKSAKERAASATELDNLDRDADLAGLELDAAQRFQKADELIYSRSEIIESALDERLATERRRHAEEARKARRNLMATDLELLAIERRGAEQRLDQARRGLASLAVTAPHAGLVVLVRDRRGSPPRVGDTVWRGQAVAQLPDLARMEAEVHVLEADAGGLAAGKPAAVTLDAHPDQVLAGTLKRVDAVAKPRVPGSPVQYFAATVDLDGAERGALRPGQRVSAVLELESIPDALLVPRQAIFVGEGGARRVFRREGGGFRPVEVTLGPVALGWAVITAGVEAGDVVALADPTRHEAAPAPPVEGGPALGGGR